MPISSIAQVLLRLFALNWILTGLIQLATMIFMVKGANLTFLNFATPALFLACGVIVWILSSALARQFARGNDASLTLQGVTLQQLYSTTFLGLGLYFSLNSVSRVFIWLHYFTISQSATANQNANATSYYEFAEPALTLAVGIIIICSAGTWARKLSLKHSVDQGAPT